MAPVFSFGTLGRGVLYIVKFRGWERAPVTALRSATVICSQLKTHSAFAVVIVCLK